MKSEKLFDLLGRLDEKTVHNILNIDSKESLRRAVAAEKNKRLHNIISIFSAAAACIALVFFMLIPMLNKASVDVPVQVTNPVTKTGSLYKLEKLLGYHVPAIENKDVSEYSFYNDENGNPYMAEIKYSDRVVFRMCAGTGDISGIYGAEMCDNRTIYGISVSFYSFPGYSYAIWERDGYAYSAASSSISIDALGEIVSLIIEITD